MARALQHPSTEECLMGGRLGEMVHGCTFDDFLFSPKLGVLERRDPRSVGLSGRVSEHVTLARPLVSANMDTVTRAEMAIVLAEEGGLGIIDRGFRPGQIEEQVGQVAIVKRTQHGVIRDPWVVAESATLAEAADLMARHRVGTLVVIDGARKLRGLLTERDVRFIGGEALASTRVGGRMTPLDRLVVHEGEAAVDDAERIMIERKIKKLPLVDAGGTLLGLITAKDILRQRRLPFATRDGQGRLRVGAAIGARGDYLERAVELIRAGVDLIVIDIAHGHSVVMERAIAAFRARVGDFELVAGNVATGDGARFLAERAVNGIKVGIGPGGGCTTRINTAFGVPQVQALVECRLAAPDVPLIADGGIRRDGSLIEALLFGADCIMLGSALAGTTEAPGEVVHKPVLLPESQRAVRVPFKVLRGMASIGAIRDRLDIEDAESADLQALGAEGLETSVPARGSVRPVIHDMLQHLCSSISYGGARSLGELRRLFWADPDRYVVKLSPAARVESYERP
jgi:IMP dehydrogenase